MKSCHIFATCLLMVVHLSCISCGHDNQPSFWNQFKDRFPRQKHFGHEERSGLRRRGPWDIPHFPDYPNNFDENSVHRDNFPFPGGPSRGDSWNFGNNNNDPIVDGNVGGGGRNNRGPVLFPIEPSTSTTQTTSRNPVTSSFRQIPNQRQPSGQPRWPLRQRPSIPSWENTNTLLTVSTSTPAVPGMQTRMPPCEEACQTTPEYNPLCGSDNITYNNMGRFNCALSCGKNIRIEYRGACPVPVRGR